VQRKDAEPRYDFGPSTDQLHRGPAPDECVIHCDAAGTRADRQTTLPKPLRTAFDHDGAALVEVMTARQELSMPPTITFEQIKGFTLYATRTVLSGRGDELIDLMTTNITRRILS
jgi:thiamine pyrophosphate-dependent acetolactate synthase large subunit-like protein